MLIHDSTNSGFWDDGMGAPSATAETIVDDQRLLSFVNIITGVSFLITNDLSAFQN